MRFLYDGKGNVTDIIIGESHWLSSTELEDYFKYIDIMSGENEKAFVQTDDEYASSGNVEVFESVDLSRFNVDTVNRYDIMSDNVIFRPFQNDNVMVVPARLGYSVCTDLSRHRVPLESLFVQGGSLQFSDEPTLCIENFLCVGSIINSISGRLKHIGTLQMDTNLSVAKQIIGLPEGLGFLMDSNIYVRIDNDSLKLGKHIERVEKLGIEFMCDCQFVLDLDSCDRSGKLIIFRNDVTNIADIKVINPAGLDKLPLFKVSDADRIKIHVEYDNELFEYDTEMGCAV